ncbi:SIS domain-containing protein [Belliella marina]|uniref:SIS domain-containing protein n=1 Tax=Belliella marina TaxID=1644146 RepID=A0ABW4VRE8_9BACT
MISTTYLNLDPQKAERAGAQETAREIAHQPRLWLDVLNLISTNRNGISTFLNPIFAKENLRIILTGAGSSAFIGESAQGLVQKNSGKLTQALPTTDLVTHPELFFMKDVPTLLISFARSGNSPESVETVRLSDIYCKHIYHFIITCNEQGQLAEYARNHSSNTFCLQLPEDANDKSLAMTGSFTSMLLSVLLVTDLNSLEAKTKHVQTAAKYAEYILNNFPEDFQRIADSMFERVIFLGSGPLLGIARECHLKLQELTDGQIVCKHDSFLGFRHGPRAVLNEKSIVVFLFSDDPHVYQYEKDLAESISSDPRGIPTISFGPMNDDGFDSILAISNGNAPTSCGDFNVLVATLVGQLLGFYKSLSLGLHPDSPSVSGAISRVVQGVKIYNKS